MSLRTSFSEPAACRYISAAVSAGDIRATHTPNAKQVRASRHLAASLPYYYAFFGPPNTRVAGTVIRMF
jgi:hypothetical protein